MSLTHLGGMRLQRHCRKVRSDRLPRESTAERSSSPSRFPLRSSFVLLPRLTHAAAAAQCPESGYLQSIHSLELPGSCCPDQCPVGPANIQALEGLSLKENEEQVNWFQNTTQKSKPGILRHHQVQGRVPLRRVPEAGYKRGLAGARALFMRQAALCLLFVPLRRPLQFNFALAASCFLGSRLLGTWMVGLLEIRH